MATQEEITAAIELLNKNHYIAVPVSKGQMYLCRGCSENPAECRYSTLGYTCSNLLCINKLIEEQLDMTILDEPKTEEK